MRPHGVLVCFLLTVFPVTLSAQEAGSYQPLSPNGASLSAQQWASRRTAPLRSAGTERGTYVLPNDEVFPHLVQGSGWQTILVLVNLGTTTVKFDQYFFGQLGEPQAVTLRTIPEGKVITTNAVTGTLAPRGSFNILLYDTGGPLQVGWSALDYDSTNSRLGGYAIFRQSIQGSVDFEALVPLSGSDDSRFVLPFDNLQNFVTSMAILNPGSISTTVQATILDLTGKVIGTDSIVLPAGNQRAFAIPDQFPVTSNAVGTILFEGSTTMLSGLGFRFNPQHAFATIPILNWQGMFQ